MQWLIRPLTEADVRAILQWRYAEPYTLYNMNTANEVDDMALFLDVRNDYHGVFNETGELAGFCCFGAEARVPGGDYAEAALDVGLGLRPDLTGRGLGAGFLAAILAFARTEFTYAYLRATVATFNGRSQRLFIKAGFHPEQTFLSRSDPPLAFVILVKKLA